MAFLHKKRTAPVAAIKVGGGGVPCGGGATRWTGLWLDSQFTLKEHHAIRLKKRMNATNWFRSLTE